MSQRAAGHGDAAKVMKDMTLTPTRAKKYRTRYNSTQNEVKKRTPSEALAIFVEADLTRKQYEVIHAANKNIYLCYSLIKRQRKTAIHVKSR
ncbi:hypothetical protein HF086_007426 [Spodoptera exigua]|uniref:Uncharacterized protein n=1 Tax=Spodoptera exigua TaxID=7107 RepID=A0A922MRW8_SPOEX|nr:hypothetical protein HF086_007426 [Spodoptera exigua]